MKDADGADEPIGSGSGAGNVRHKAEVIAAIADENIKKFEKTQELENELRASDEEMERKVENYVRAGVLKVNHAYLTSKGVLTITTHFADRSRVQVSLLPLATNCHHAEPNKPA